MELFNAAGGASRLRASPLLAIGPSEPGPALRRGALVAVPVGLALLLELGLDSATKGAIGTGALLAGFPGLDAPARTRAAWQAAVAPLIGLAAALGVLTGPAPCRRSWRWRWSAPPPATASPSRCASRSPASRSLLPWSSPRACRLTSATSGRPSCSRRPADCCRRPSPLCVWIAGDRSEEGGAEGWNGRAALGALRSNLSLSSTSFRHALRFGAALAAGVSVYWLLGMHEHGFWIPLTILFVLRPEKDETFRRLILRAVGTAVGLVLATGAGRVAGR